MVHSDATSLVELVYEIPGRLAEILGLKAEDAIDMTTSDEAYPCQNQDVYHYTSQQISDAMEQILKKIMFLRKMSWNIICMIMEH